MTNHFLNYAKEQLCRGSAVARVLLDALVAWPSCVTAVLPRRVTFPVDCSPSSFRRGGVGNVADSQRELTALVQHALTAPGQVFIVENVVAREGDNVERKFRPLIRIHDDKVYYQIDARMVQQAELVIRHATHAFHFLGFLSSGIHPSAPSTGVIGYAKTASMVVLGAFDAEGYVVVGAAKRLFDNCDGKASR